MHSSKGLRAGCKEIGRRAIQYVTNRNLFMDGAYSINVDDFSSHGIMQSIREKMGSAIPINDHNALLQELKDKDLIIQFNINMDQDLSESDIDKGMNQIMIILENSN